MRTVWLIEQALSPARHPMMLAENCDQLLYWTSDVDLALQFSEHLSAVRFAQNSVTDNVVIGTRVIDGCTGWPAYNIARRAARDAMDAFKAHEAAAALARSSA